MPDFIAKDYDTGDTIPQITLDTGETFENAIVAGREYDPADSGLTKGWARLTIEGDWWEQVKDRVGSEVLHVHQETTRGGDRWKPAKVVGTVWRGEPEEASEPEDKTLGTVTEVSNV